MGLEFKGTVGNQLGHRKIQDSKNIEDSGLENKGGVEVGNLDIDYGRVRDISAFLNADGHTRLRFALLW